MLETCTFRFLPHVHQSVFLSCFAVARCWPLSTERRGSFPNPLVIDLILAFVTDYPDRPSRHVTTLSKCPGFLSYRNFYLYNPGDIRSSYSGSVFVAVCEPLACCL